MNDLNISIESNIQIILNSRIEIQGDAVLEVIDIGERFAKYKLIGFSRPEIFICDFRKHCLGAAKALDATKANLERWECNGFIDQFTKPALLCIKQLEDKNIVIELRNAKKENPNYMLFIAIGIKKVIIPNYNFLVKRIASFESNKKALFFIIKIPST